MFWKNSLLILLFFNQFSLSIVSIWRYNRFIDQIWSKLEIYLVRKLILNSKHYFLIFNDSTSTEGLDFPKWTFKIDPELTRIFNDSILKVQNLISISFKRNLKDSENFESARVKLFLKIKKILNLKHFLHA